MPGSYAYDLICALRITVRRPEILPLFIDEEVKRAKQIQRKNSEEYEVAQEAYNQALGFFVTNGLESDLLCALALLSILLRLDPSSAERSQYNSYLVHFLKKSRTIEEAQFATKVFADTLDYDDAVTKEYIKTQIETGLKWMNKTTSDLRRISGIWILTEIAFKAADDLVSHFEEIFQRMWASLAAADNPNLQNAALALFSTCTKRLARTTYWGPGWRARAFEMVMVQLSEHLRSNVVEKNIAGLLAFPPLVNSLGKNTSVSYESLSLLLTPFTMETGAHSSTLYELILHCLLALCQYKKKIFITSQLKETVHFALSNVGFHQKRTAAFQVLSEMIKIVGDNYRPYVVSTCDKIREVFENSADACWEALECFAVICNVCPPPNLSKNLEACISHVFQWGLSPQLIHSFQSLLNAAGSSHQKKLEESLLDKISLTLCGLPFRHTASSPSRPLFKPSLEDEDVAVALNALMEFSFSSSDLMGNFLRDSVLPFIISPSPAVRNAAVRAIINLLLPSAQYGEMSIGRRLCVEAVLEKMMNAAVSHEDAFVRESIMSSFTPAFYPFLSNLKYFDRFHSAIGDESVNCRIEALRQMCGMMNYDPSHILPVLRKVLCTVLHNINLDFTLDSQVVDCLRLMKTLCDHAPQYVVHFSDGILDLLLPRFRLITVTSSILLPFLSAYTSLAAAISYFRGDNTSSSFREEIALVLLLLDTIPKDRTFQSRCARVVCYRFLSVALAPLIDHQSPYQLYPDLFRHISSVIHNVEEPNVLRLEALKCLGKIGALDVTMFQAFEANSREVLPAIGSTVILSSPSQKDCASVVLRAISAILDPTDKRFNPGDNLVRSAVEAILDIGMRCPSSHAEMHVVVAPLARSIMQLSGKLMATVLLDYCRILKKAGKASLNDSETLFCLFHYVWTKEPKYRYLAVRVFSTVSSFNVEAESSSVKYFQTIPLILNSLNRSDSSTALCFSIVGALIRNVDRLQPLCESVIESLLNSIDAHVRSVSFLATAMNTIKIMCLKLRVYNMAGAIVRHFIQILYLDIFRSNATLCAEVVDIFVILLQKIKEDFFKHAAFIVEQLRLLHIDHSKFVSMYESIVEHQPNADNLTCWRVNDLISRVLTACDQGVDSIIELGDGVDGYAKVSEADRILIVNEDRLISELKELVQRRGEFGRWSNRFSMIILKESPYQVFRCVTVSSGVDATSLAEECPAVTSEIVLLAFRTVWSYSSAVLRNALLEFFNTAFKLAKETVLTDEVVSLLLSIVEYMDHSGEPLDLSPALLSDCACNLGMLAKAVYWREAAYRQSPSETVESLISLYSELHMMQSSLGIFNLVDADRRRYLLQSSLIKLSRYEEALQIAQQDLEREEEMSETPSENVSRSHGESIYSKSLYSALTSDSESHPTRGNHIAQATIQLMLCLSKLGDYDQVINKWDSLIQKDNSSAHRRSHNDIVLSTVSEYAADACIRLQKWSKLGEVLEHMTDDSVPYHITRAVRFIKTSKYNDALHCVTAGRKLLLDDLSNIQESYARSYEPVIVAQKLTELEEIIYAYIFQQKFDSMKPVHHIMTLFENRIQIMVPSVRSWKQVLGLRGLLADPSNDVKTRIRFVQLCRLESAKYEEKFTLMQLLGHQNVKSSEELLKKTANPRVVMEYIAYASNSGLLGAGTALGPEKDLIKKMIDTYSKPENESIIARAYARLGSIVDLRDSLECYRSATLHDPQWHLAWRLWAEANAEILNEEYSDKLITNAIDGYIQSILLGTTEAALIQDVLKLMTLWSVHGDQPRGLKELKRRVFDVPTRVWYLVVPQLIAHLDSGTNSSCELVAEILTVVSLDYPNTLIFPLNLCRCSIAEDSTKSDRRKSFAIAIMKKMEAKYPLLILQGKLVIEELNRLSSLINERVFDKLEEAATQFFTKRNTDGMVRTLQSLHANLPTIPEGVAESEFLSSFGRMLAEAEQWINMYVKTGDVVAIQSAWNLYHSVYRQINEQQKRTKTLSIQFHSPKLYEAHHLEFCLPDTSLLKGRTLSKISSFNPTMIIIASKQRPKRLSVNTSDGRRQKFLLKGREDLRLDERVMQLFLLINILMLSDSRSSKNFGFQVQQYTVTPLRETAGLIGWVDGCDTMTELVKRYRTNKDVALDVEFRVMNQIIVVREPKSYDNLSQLSKIEVMEFLADHTSGQDIRKVMWATAPNCEMWIDQRRQYMTSLANMSMVGYILGLGDRHPNNIMLQKGSGHIVHIDFGDCFEVTMTRDRFPEKVPFRLTRMLRNAMDVSGIDGSFRSFSETSMSVLRKGSHSVLALMQAFIQDPLISWRLVALPGKDPQESTEEHRSIEEVHVLDEKKLENRDNVEAADATTPNEGEANDTSGNVDYSHHGIVVYARLKSKLEGKDFTFGDYTSSFNVGEQVNQLIDEATDISNVSQLWSGWYPFW